MILQVFLLFLIVILFLSALNMATCKKDKPFILKGKCVEKCNPGMVLDKHNRCVYSCPQDSVLNENDNNLYTENESIGRCAKCVQGLYAYKDDCVENCPEESKVIDIRRDGLACVKECPSFKKSVLDTVDNKTYCIPDCEDNTLYDPVSLRCVEKCTVYAPYENMKDGVRICDNECPVYYTSDNKCVGVCAPELVKYYKNKIYCGNCPEGSSVSASNSQVCVDNV